MLAGLLLLQLLVFSKTTRCRVQVQRDQQDAVLQEVEDAMKQLRLSRTMGEADCHKATLGLTDFHKAKLHKDGYPYYLQSFQQYDQHSPVAVNMHPGYELFK